jgi:hypothetical protein
MFSYDGIFGPACPSTLVTPPQRGLNDLLWTKLHARPLSSVADPEPDPEGAETFGRIRIRFGTKINVSDPDPKLEPKKICKKEHYVVSTIAVQ